MDARACTPQAVVDASAVGIVHRDISRTTSLWTTRSGARTNSMKTPVGATSGSSRTRAVLAIPEVDRKLLEGDRNTIHLEPGK